MPRVERNLVDRVVEYFSPESGGRRLAARAALAMAGGYLGGKKDRRFTQNWNPGLGDANRDVVWDLPTLRERSRDACRNQPMALGLKNTMMTYTIGTGLMHHARPRWEFLPVKDEDARRKWQLDTERKFFQFCESREIDIERRKNFWQMQRLVWGSKFESGDCFVAQVAKPRQTSRYAIALQVIEADRVRNPNDQANTHTLVEGIETDVYGAPRTIWVMKHHPGSLVPSIREWDPFDVEGPYGRKNILHIMDELRPGQLRGVPALAPFLEILKKADDYRDAEQVAAMVASWFTILLKSSNASGFSMDGAVPGLNGSGSGSQDPAKPELGPGIIARMRPDDDAVIVNPGRPNQAFGPFMQSIAEQVGMGSGISYEVYLHHYSSSFSASKGAQADTHRACRPGQEEFAFEFCQEFYNAWLSEAVAIGDIQAPGYFADPEVRRAWQGSEWTGDAPISIDPVKEAAAVTERLRNGTSDKAAEIAAYSGRSYEDVLAQRIKERKQELAAGLIQDPPAPGAAPPSAPANSSKSDNGDDEEED